MIEYSGAEFKNSIVFQIPVFEDKKIPFVDKMVKKYKTNEHFYMAATEAGYFQEYGIDCTIFGVGDIKDAHSTNEKLYLKDYLDYQDKLLDIIKEYCAN